MAEGFSDFLSSVGNVFGEIASAINAIFAFLWNVMLSLFTFIWNTLVSVVTSIVNVFQKAQTFFTHLWEDYLKVAFGKIWAWIKLLFTHPIQAVQQLNDWIHKIRKWYDTHILPILKRQQQMLQRIRQMLVPLRILHVKWAQKLDNYLQDAEARIAQSIEIVRGHLNQISDWLELLTTPSRMARLIPHALWITKVLDSILHTFTGGGLSMWLKRADTSGYGRLKNGKFSTIKDSMHEANTTGTGDFAAIGEQAKQTYQRFNEDML